MGVCSRLCALVELREVFSTVHSCRVERSVLDCALLCASYTEHNVFFADTVMYILTVLSFLKMTSQQKRCCDNLFLATF